MEKEKESNIQEEEEKKNFIKEIKKKNEILNFSNDLFELRGNINYLKCTKNCSEKIFSNSNEYIFEKEIPKCPFCGNMARPYFLLNDETNLEEDNFRNSIITNIISQYDCIIIIGNNPKTQDQISTNIISQAIENSTVIIEVNEQPNLEIGNVKQLIGPIEDIVPYLCKIIESLYKKYAYKE